MGIKIGVFGEWTPHFEAKTWQGQVPCWREIRGLRVLVVVEDSREALIAVGIAIAYQVAVLSLVDLAVDHHMIETVEAPELETRLAALLERRAPRASI